MAQMVPRGSGCGQPGPPVSGGPPGWPMMAYPGGSPPRFASKAMAPVPPQQFALAPPAQRPSHPQQQYGNNLSATAVNVTMASGMMNARIPAVPSSAPPPIEGVEHVVESYGPATLESRIDKLEHLMRNVIDVTQDHTHSLQLEGQERMELSRLLEQEQGERQRLTEELNAEREVRIAELEQMKSSIRYVKDLKDGSSSTEDGDELGAALKALQNESAHRHSQLEQIARQLNQECETRAFENRSFMQTLQELSTRTNDVQLLAESISHVNGQSNHDANSGAAAGGGSSPEQSISALRTELHETRQKMELAGQTARLSSEARATALENLVGQMQADVIALTRRLEELTKAVLDEREAVKNWMSAAAQDA